MQHLIKARDNAYAPYSKFHVGTALLLDNGEIVSGSNQENVTYPSGLCAKHTAIFYSAAKFPKAKVIKMVLTVTSQNQKTKYQFYLVELVGSLLQNMKPSKINT